MCKWLCCKGRVMVLQLTPGRVLCCLQVQKQGSDIWFSNMKNLTEQKTHHGKWRVGRHTLKRNCMFSAVVTELSYAWSQIVLFAPGYVVINSYTLGAVFAAQTLPARTFALTNYLRHRLHSLFCNRCTEGHFIFKIKAPGSKLCKAQGLNTDGETDHRSLTENLKYNNSCQISVPDKIRFLIVWKSKTTLWLSDDLCTGNGKVTRRPWRHRYMRLPWRHCQGLIENLKPDVNEFGLQNKSNKLK